MKKVILTIELEYDDILMHSGDADGYAKAWFEDYILGGELLVHSDELGDTIGTAKIINRRPVNLGQKNTSSK